MIWLDRLGSNALSAVKYLLDTCISISDINLTADINIKDIKAAHLVTQWILAMFATDK